MNEAEMLQWSQVWSLFEKLQVSEAEIKGRLEWEEGRYLAIEFEVCLAQLPILVPPPATHSWLPTHVSGTVSQQCWCDKL